MLESARKSYQVVVAWLLVAATVVADHMRSRRAAFAVAPMRSRGVTYIEYALLAAVAVAIAAIFRTQLTNTFTTLLGRFNSEAGKTTG